MNSSCFIYAKAKGYVKKEHELLLYHEKVQRNPSVHSGVYEMKGHADIFQPKKQLSKQGINTVTNAIQGE
jgi:hypothetical protein